MGNLESAKSKLLQGDYTCVACKGDTCYTSVERGVKPLLNWLDKGISLKGFSAADRVVGKGAALLYARLEVAEVYAIVISESGAKVLEDNHIKVYFDAKVPFIVNRQGTGMCPMEKATAAVDDPVQGEAVIRHRLAQLRS